MPNTRESALAVHGRVIDVEAAYDRDRKFTGLKCLVKGIDGFTSTRLNPEAAQEVKPSEGDEVVWFVRPGALKGDNDQIVFFTAFVRQATESDIDSILSRAGLKPAAV